MTANAHLLPVAWPSPALQEFWESGVQTMEGATQPWVQALLYQLCRALDVRHAVELGCWKGITSVWLATAISHNGGGSLSVVDNHEKTGGEALARLSIHAPSNVAVTLHQEPTMTFLLSLLASTQFVFLDDDKAQIADKLDLIRARAPGCYVAVHDAELPNVTIDFRKAGGIILDIPPGDGSGSLGLIRL